MTRLLLLIGALLAGCGASHLERAKGHRQAALDAQAAGDMLSANGETQAAIEAAKRSRAEDEGVEAQTWIIQAWGHLALGQMTEAQPALQSALKAHRGGAPAWQQRVLIAAQCAFATQNRWWYFSALCHDHLLARLSESADGLQAFALEGFANANAMAALQHSISYLDLIKYEHPLFTRHFEAARSHPLNGDLLAMLAGRLEEFCEEPIVVVQRTGWAAFQLDLWRAAQALDGFTNDARRKSVAKGIERAQREPLCAP
jgi:tetratricopeptide (TPR) repeat protein